MAKFTTQPVDAIIGVLISEWDKSVFNGGLVEATNANGMNGNILKADNFRNYKPKDNRYTEFIVVGHPRSAGIIRNRGSYSHFIGRYPIVIETHSMRSDDRAEAWKDEVWDIMQDRRIDITSSYSDYRKIWIEVPPLDVSAGTKFKWVINIELEAHITEYP